MPIEVASPAGRSEQFREPPFTFAPMGRVIRNAVWGARIWISFGRCKRRVWRGRTCRSYYMVNRRCVHASTAPLRLDRLRSSRRPRTRALATRVWPDTATKIDARALLPCRRDLPECAAPGERVHACLRRGSGGRARPLTTVSRWPFVPSPRPTGAPPPGRAIYLARSPSPRRCAARWRHAEGPFREEPPALAHFRPRGGGCRHGVSSSILLVLV